MTELVMVITVDTEQDCTATWMARHPLSFRSVYEGILERFQPLCDELGARPTYLLSPPVIEDRESAVGLAALPPTTELGAHMHGDYLEPQRTLFGDRPGRTSELGCCYPPALEAAKLANLTHSFQQTFGYAPTSFRAGRFAADADTLGLLAKLGYRVDSSVTPHVRWLVDEGDVDHRTAPDQPYRPSERDITVPGSLPILEVPISILEHGALPGRRRYRGIRGVLRGFPDIRARLGQPLWLRPSFSSSDDMCFVVDQFLKRHAGRQFVVLNMMFHSVELVGGTSPYASTEQAASELLQRIADTLRHSAALGCRFATLSSLPALVDPGHAWETPGI